MEEVSEMFTLSEISAPRESSPFWRHLLVDSVRVSALTAPDEVIVGNDIPVPADTLRTVPPPALDISRARLSATF